MEDLKAYMQEKYPTPGDLIDIKVDENTKNILIIGYKCKEVKNLASTIVEDYFAYNFPDTWVDTFKLIIGNEDVVLKDV